MSNNFQSQLISVIIPAEDEAKSIHKLIAEVKKSLSEYPHEIIVVDDGSRDGTAQIAGTDGIIVISHEKNQGKGAAMKTGVRHASGDIIVFLDGDGAHNPQDIPGVIAPFLDRKADLVIGSRTLPESKVFKSPLSRRLSNNLASWVISIIISLILPMVTFFRCPLKYTRITDCTSGFRGIKKEAWEKLNLTSQGFQIETEMIYEAAKNRLNTTEVPISCDWNGRLSRLSIVRDGLKTLKLLTVKLIGDLGGSKLRER